MLIFSFSIYNQNQNIQRRPIDLETVFSCGLCVFSFTFVCVEAYVLAWQCCDRGSVVIWYMCLRWLGSLSCSSTEHKWMLNVLNELWGLVMQPDAFDFGFSLLRSPGSLSFLFSINSVLCTVLMGTSKNNLQLSFCRSIITHPTLFWLVQLPESVWKVSS